MNILKSWITNCNYLKKFTLLICSILLLTACQKDNTKPMTTKHIEVAPYLVDCTGVAPIKCMKIKEQGQAEWEFFYGSIDGFTFEPGYNYQLEVNVTKKSEPIPADASSLQWTLVKVINKQKAINN